MPRQLASKNKYTTIAFRCISKYKLHFICGSVEFCPDSIELKSCVAIEVSTYI